MENLYGPRIGTRLGSVLVLGDEVVQVVPIQRFGAKQNCSSRHLDRTSTCHGSEQIHPNSLLVVTCLKQKFNVNFQIVFSQQKESSIVAESSHKMV